MRWEKKGVCCTLDCLGRTFLPPGSLLPNPRRNPHSSVSVITQQRLNGVFNASGPRLPGWALPGRKSCTAARERGGHRGLGRGWEEVLGLAAFGPRTFSAKSIEGGQAQWGGTKVPSQRPCQVPLCSRCQQVGWMGVAKA